jgi:hypothetical protein
MWSDPSEKCGQGLAATHAGQKGDPTRVVRVRSDLANAADHERGNVRAGHGGTRQCRLGRRHTELMCGDVLEGTT